MEVVTDLSFANRPPKRGWRAWMQQSVEDSEVVLLVCTARYKALFEKRPTDNEGGFGATWEGAIITNDLYFSRLGNEKYFPILPDGGDPGHVPAVLRDFDNNHRFPSGNARILALIRGEAIAPSPKQANPQSLPCEILLADDARLMPREGEVIGRRDELAQVTAFLESAQASAAVCGHVTGSGGIGKTEVCKAALRAWLRDTRDTRIFWLQVSDQADAGQLLAQLGLAAGLDQQTAAAIKAVAQLRPHLPAGLYCLDNLESVAESPGGRELLRELGQTPGLKLLASSRVALDGVLGVSIQVGPLQTEEAVQLFLKCWDGRSEPEPEDLAKFVSHELGGHALSITLLARLGRAYAWARIKELWREQGAALAKARKASGRLDSLEISFSLSENL